MFGNLWGNLYIPCLLLIITIRFTCGDTKILSNIKMSQIIMTRIVANNCWKIKNCFFPVVLYLTWILEFVLNSLPMNLDRYSENFSLAPRQWRAKAWSKWGRVKPLPYRQWQLCHVILLKRVSTTASIQTTPFRKLGIRVGGRG